MKGREWEAETLTKEQIVKDILNCLSMMIPCPGTPACRDHIPGAPATHPISGQELKCVFFDRCASEQRCRWTAIWEKTT